MVHGAGIDEPVLRLTGSTGSTTATQAAYLQDGLGSVVGTVNTAGTLSASQRFDAWGAKTAGTGTVPQYGFTGREPDASGLVYYRARYYHPGIGRFASPDPMGMVDAPSLYAYVGNSPANAIDPYGLLAQDPVKVAGLGGMGNYWSAAEQMGSNIYSALPSRQTLNTFLDNTQTALDYAGVAAQGPAEVVAPFIDAASAVTSLIRGDYAGAGLSVLSAGRIQAPSATGLMIVAQ
jgi:RHS repeat-associated protein